MSDSTRAAHRITIVGGGAGGLELATRLGRRLGRRAHAEITLVDARLTHLWKPLLHEVAAGSLNAFEDELNYVALAHWNGFRFRLGALESVDRRAHTITIAPSVDEQGREFIPRRSIGYDTLVIAIGSTSHDFGVPGVAEHCMFLDSREQADRFHRDLLRAVFAANAQSEPLREGQLHIAIAGAGATGVELAAELRDSLRAMVEYGFDRIVPQRDVRIVLIEGRDRILPGLPERISAATHKLLESIGVEVYTGERIEAVTAQGFRRAGGMFVAAEIRVWAAGIKAPAVLANLDNLDVNHLGQLIVRPTLQTRADDHIFAFGDCAYCLYAGGVVPPRAQAAHQQAALLVRSIENRLAGKPLPVFVYRDYGSLINLSRYSAVGNLMGNLMGRKAPTALFVEGWFARLAYLSLYKLHQLAVLGFVRTALETLANLLTQRSRPRLKLH
ncbi:MAG: NAD(P)/FAD-dependent oxidoreductase [Gammaproteobacteria bacterium]|nr:NAD(P)/FAD-dependent oxidoreductase [Gammaproteobacteria bacterium]